MIVENYIFGKVLDNIAREEGEDRPNISQLLAWAKGDIIVCWVDSHTIIALITFTAKNYKCTMYKNAAIRNMFLLL